MSGAVLEKVPLMGGELEICRFANKPKYWYFRMYVRASGNQKRTYIKRTLRTEDRGQSRSRAPFLFCGSSRRSKRTVVP